MANIGTYHWTVRQMVDNINSGKVTYDNYIQRSQVWKRPVCSLLIDTLINKYIVPPFYCAKLEDGTLDFLDGKQRSLAINQFINGDYALEGLDPFVDDDGNDIDLNGKFFSDLIEEHQNRIKDFVLDIIYIEDANPDLLNTTFLRINSGVQLKSFMKLRARAPYITEFNEIGKHPAIQNIMTLARKENKTDDLIAMQMYILLYTDIPSFVPADLEETIVHAELKQSQFKQMNEILDLAEAVVTNGFDPETKADKKIITKLKVQNHFIALIYLCSKVKDEDKVIDDSEAEKITNILKEFAAIENMEDQFSEEDMKKIDEYQEKNKEEIEKLGEEYSTALMALITCEGADKIKFE